MRKAVLLGLAGLASTPVHAQQWTHLATVDEQWEIYLDPSAVTREGPAARFWIRRDWVRGRGNGHYYLSQGEIDCAARTARILITVTYRSDGSEVSRDTQPVPADPIAPNTLFDQIGERVC